MYGKYWDYNQRQWKNLGLRFDDNKNVTSDCVVDILESNDNRFGYLSLYIQIVLLKQEITKHNDELITGLRPEFIYDKWTWKSTKLQSYCRDESGNLKPNIQKRPFTHLFNCYKTWLSQMFYDMKHRPGRYEHRTNEVDKKTTLMSPQKMSMWLAGESDDWIDYWVHEDTENCIDHWHHADEEHISDDDNEIEF